MSKHALVFPHQLFKEVVFPSDVIIHLVEEHLFFNQYAFHKEKLAFHRASMKAYQQYLSKYQYGTHYIEAHEKAADVRVLVLGLHAQGCRELHFIDPIDDWLMRRLQSVIQSLSLQTKKYPSALFLNSTEENQSFFKPDRKKFFQTKFYINQRKKFGLLLDADDAPLGGKWSFDPDNRKKYPKGKVAPPVRFPEPSLVHKEAVDYVQKHFSSNPGDLSVDPRYPINFDQSEVWLQQFLEQRFHEFGPYEDAIVKEEPILHHSVLTPMLNVGLITPQHVIEKALAYADQHDVPINSTEGFVRQIVGWREFIRGLYECKGRESRTRNFWGFSRKIPNSFYTGSTGIVPVDLTIQSVLQTGYCHHIERLMVLGNFMLLCEFDPNEVYRWFMEMFIDAYDWVMVPNVYGMSQFADGGLFATKPYISGSNYLMKMSNYPKGDWQPVWDGLFWRFMHIHRDFFLRNPRLGMLVRTFDKMATEKKQAHLDCADSFLAAL
ncbi:MAG: cryptochrome/photolyase family protein [Saprospiraceae bacterium]|nr:cryptochrome/photolyase family protein [Saprospiraceae bacterium]